MQAAAREEVRRGGEGREGWEGQEGRVGGNGGTPQQAMKKVHQTTLLEVRWAQVWETAQQERSARSAALLAWVWSASAANPTGAGVRVGLDLGLYSALRVMVLRLRLQSALTMATIFCKVETMPSTVMMCCCSRVRGTGVEGTAAVGVGEAPAAAAVADMDC
jgi:hypothetical protein